MKCPRCKKEITKIKVFSECWQWGRVKGKTIIDYGPVEEVLEVTIRVECSNCWADLTNLFE